MRLTTNMHQATLAPKSGHRESVGQAVSSRRHGLRPQGGSPSDAMKKGEGTMDANGFYNKAARGSAQCR